MLCVKCKQDLPEENFSKATRNMGRNCLQSFCKKCMLSYGKAHREQNRERYRQRSRERSKTLHSRLKQLLNTNTTDRSSLSYELCLDRIIKNNLKCEITGIPFTFGPKDPTALSIDRIDPTKGYTMDNVRFVCWWINAAMSNWGLLKLEELIKDWHENKEV